MKMKTNLFAIVICVVWLVFQQTDGHPWPGTPTNLHAGIRAKRGVDLTTLRRLMNNIAMSEYYRLRGLEVLGTIGMNSGRPGGISGANDESAAPTKAKELFDFPSRNKEFQQFFGTLGALRRRG